MGHRHVFNTSQMFESDHDQNWNHMQTEQSFGHMAGAGSADNGSFFYPMENMFVDGMHFASHWNPLPRSNGFSSSSHNVDVPRYPPDASGSSHDPFQHPLNGGTFPAVAENFAHHTSSSNYDRQTLQGIEGGFIDLTMGNGSGPHKRKSPGIPSGCDRGSTSRYYGAGSSSDVPIPSELRHEKVGLDTQHMPWDLVNMNPNYRGHGLSIRAEGSMRNVRSRSTHDLESNLARTHLSSNPSHNSYSTNPIEHPSTLDLSVQPSAGLNREWNHFGISPPGGALVSDTSVFSHEPVQRFLLGSNSSNEGYHHDFIQNRSDVVPQSYPGTPTQPVRGVRSSYSQRSSPTMRASSSSLRLGHAAPPPDEGLQLVTESHSRHPRPLSNIGWRSAERHGPHGRSRISNERYRVVPDETGFHDRFSSEGFMVVERSALYGSRNISDQHRDMRLDVDNMSYEELLALGERIGSVSTGLSADFMSKCVTETIYCSSDQIQEEGTCVICLEEYKNMDDVGSLKTCGHDYHVNCIKKWLSMKNLCPICKAPALADTMKEK